MFTITKLSAGYDDLGILKDVSLTLHPRAISVLMGPNGAGKSTLLKSIFNLATITSGKIVWHGEDITRFPTHRLLAKGIAFVPQGRINFGTLSVKENLLMGARHERDTTRVATRLAQVYEQFPGLQEKEHQLAFRFSGGQQQMLAIGRALMSAPQLLLMDEPSLGLAPKLVKEMFVHIRELKEQFGVTVLIVEHNLKSLMDMADYGYVMVAGEIVAQDSCAELKNSDIMKKVFVGEFD